MMNPLVQKTLGKTYAFPSSSGKNPEGPDTKEWTIENHPTTGAITVDDPLSSPPTPFHHLGTRYSFHLRFRHPLTKTPSAAKNDNNNIRLRPRQQRHHQLQPTTPQTATQQALRLPKRPRPRLSPHSPFRNMGIHDLCRRGG